MKTIAFTYNARNQESQELLSELAAYARSRGLQVAEHQGKDGFSLDDLSEEAFRHCDAVIALGGDGTMLASSRVVAMAGAPLYGVNMGKVGFLSAVERGDAFKSIDRLLAGDYQLSERLMLDCRLERAGEIATRCSAFNDIVVSGDSYTRAVSMELFINGHFLHAYSGDGMIVASPTGSTGYSLSAGGPILMPELELLLVTPICAHSFFTRPVIARPDAEVMVISRSRAGVAALTADGQFRFSLQPDDRVIVSAAEHKARLIYFDQINLFDRIKDKLYF